MIPKISVIVPIYNTEQYLPECIDSILAQSFTDIELILVNDGSPDNSGQICEYYREKDSRVRIVNKENGGLSSARNAGLEIAVGNYIMFVDSDDYLEPDCFEKAYTTMTAANADLYIGGYYEVHEADGQKISRGIKEARLYSTRDLFEKYNIHYPSHWLSMACMKLFKTAIIQTEKIRFDEWFNYKEDAPFVYTYLQYTDSVFFDSHPVYNYRLRTSGSLNVKIHQNMYEINCEVYRLKRDVMRGKCCPANVYNNVYFGSMRQSIGYFYLSDHPDCRANRFSTIEKVCENDLLSEISLRDLSGFKQKLLLVLCRIRAKRIISMMFWLQSRIRG